MDEDSQNIKEAKSGEEECKHHEWKLPHAGPYPRAFANCGMKGMEHESWESHTHFSLPRLAPLTATRVTKSHYILQGF